MTGILNEIQKVIDERKWYSKKLLGKGTAYDDYMDYVEFEAGKPFMTMVDDVQACVDNCKVNNSVSNRTKLIRAMNKIEPYIRADFKSLVKRIKSIN